MKTLSTFIIFIFSLTAFAQDYYFEEPVAFEDRHHLSVLPADGDLNDLVFKYRVLIKGDIPCARGSWSCLSIHIWCC